MTIEDSVTALRGVGDELAKKLASLGIHTIDDLLHYYPRRYDDFSSITSIKEIRPGSVTVKGRITQVTGRYVRRGMHITEAIMSDQTASTRLVWFNQPYRAKALRPGAEYYVSGQYELSRLRLAIMNPSVELVSDFPVNTARIIPVYSEKKGLKSQQLRQIIKGSMNLIQQLPETLPEWLVRELALLNKSKAVLWMHFPDSAKALQTAKKRLAFEEVFELSLASVLSKMENQREKALRIPFDEELARQFVQHLPFQLTPAQKKTVWQIYLDMQKQYPMNRLVEGDVGSGKTVVATMAALMAMQQGFQVALMAPTEILARQHAETIFQLLMPLGFNHQVSLLIGGMKTLQKNRALNQIAKGQVRFIVGTHALIQERVDMHKLGLIIIDEQHRFGVQQRKKLQAKAGHMPHVLSMTATPIPRTLALTLYGELDISVIDTVPSGRKHVITTITSPNSRAQLYRAVEKELINGRQTFIVCPLISDGVKNVPSAESMYKLLSTTVFKHRRIGLLHGKMKAEAKAAAMDAFIAHKTDILIATTVIEVGVNVPNASVMIIEGAERLGLAQIHQLRGRVGRSSHQGFCYLVPTDSSTPSPRLRALESSTDGFSLAELDLELRGPGAIYGTLQHGQLDLRIANLSDTKLIAAARHAANEFIKRNEDLLKYEHLAKKVKALQAVTNLN